MYYYLLVKHTQYYIVTWTVDQTLVGGLNQVYGPKQHIQSTITLVEVVDPETSIDNKCYDPLSDSR